MSRYKWTWLSEDEFYRRWKMLGIGMLLLAVVLMIVLGLVA